MKRFIENYQRFKPFTYDEGVVLFKIAAISEAIGWSLLISGILISRYITPGNDIAVQIAGRLHGTLFLIYITGVLVIGPSLKWNKSQTLVAALCSVPPYGSIIFEMWFTHKRKSLEISKLKGLLYYRSLCTE